MPNQPEPKLAPAGAGLPLPELQVARVLFALARWKGNKASFNARFQHERETIRRRIDSCDEATGARRVLIERPRGLEDSSRFWSVWMTLDHLRIVHSGMNRVIRDLVAGVTPEGTASTAAVKPSADATAAVVAPFEASCDALLGTVAEAGDLKTPLRFTHPWFGPLDAFGWHALSAGHLRIHRVQIERICDGLPKQIPTLATESG
jgi:hypothetical protein